MRQSYKDVLTNAQSAFLLAEILADKEKVEMRADTFAVTENHKQTRDEVMIARKANCCYGCKVGSSLGCYKKLGKADAQWIQAI
jgi:hypothetical protein